MKLTPAASRDMRRLALDVVLLDGEQDAAPSLADMARRAKALLDGALREKRRAPKKLAPGKTREERRAETKARRAAIRAEVFARAERERGGRCEWYCERPAEEWHHIFQGGERSARESTATTAAACVACHRAYHKADRDTLRNAATWAVEHGFREAAREIAHRIDLAEMTRRTA